jgi:GT2 family glycosyltransferase
LKHPILSVVIVHFNAKEFLYLTLQALTKIQEKLDIEIIVVDNHSNEKIDAFQEWFPKTILHFLDKNIGFGAANNFGVAGATSENILIQNPDTIIQESLIHKALEIINSDEKIGAVGVRMIDGKGEYLPESKRKIPNLKSSILRILKLDKILDKISNDPVSYYSNSLDNERDGPVEIIAGACFFIKKANYNKINGFDTRFFLYGEDIDFSYQLLQNGFENYYIGSESIVHFKGESSNKNRWSYYQNFFEALYIFWEKNMTKNASKFEKFLFKSATFGIIKLSQLKLIFKGVFFPIIDFVLLYVSIYGFTFFWSTNLKGDVAYYPPFFYLAILPAYVSIWILSNLIQGVYRVSTSINNYFAGATLGAFLILIIYNFLPLNYRYSRAIVLAGTVFAFFLPLFFKLILSKVKRTNFISFDFKILPLQWISNHKDGISYSKELFSLFTNFNISIDEKEHQNKLVDVSHLSNESLIAFFKQKNDSVWMVISKMDTLIHLANKQKNSMIYSPYNNMEFQKWNSRMFHFILHRFAGVAGILTLWPIWSGSKITFQDLLGTSMGLKDIFYSKETAKKIKIKQGVFSFEDYGFDTNALFFYQKYQIIEDVKWILYFLNKRN